MNERAPGERPARWIRIAVYAVAIATVAMASYAWAADAIAGHIGNG